jgi:UDP-N-acetylglucosamine 3-dehydrogenase
LIRVAMIGCGTVARVNHLPGLRAGGDADIAVFASRSLASAQLARDTWGSGDVTTDWTAAIERDDVDAVHVCVPNALHAPVAAAALRAGKHVLVEKPMTTTTAEADELLGLASDRVLGVAFDARSNPALIELRRLLPAVGPLRSVDVHLGHPGPQAWAPDATWFRDPELAGGGCLLDLGSHVLDALAWCMGPVTEVVSAHLDGPVDEQAELSLLCGDGVPASVVVSWQLTAPEFAFVVTGDKGVIALRGGELLHNGAPVEIPPVELPNAAASFARAVATGAAPTADGRDGRAALAAVLAGYGCAQSGRPVLVA